LQSFSTDEGMQIDESDEHHENADSSIHESLEHDSNVIVERDLQQQKHSLQSVRTDEGMQIDESDEQYENADCPIRKT
jgi:hypothetical protein